jgi:ketosteroid isomerase-like protein
VTSLESQNTEQVARIFEAFARGDVPYILDQLADDVRFHSHLDASVPWAGEFVGKENVVRFFQALGVPSKSPNTR